MQRCQWKTFLSGQDRAIRCLVPYDTGRWGENDSSNWILILKTLGQRMSILKCPYSNNQKHLQLQQHTTPTPGLTGPYWCQGPWMQQLSQWVGGLPPVSQCVCFWGFFFVVYCYKGLLFLAGGNSNIFYFQPANWGNDPVWRAYFSNGLKPPTSLCFYWDMVCFRRVRVLLFHILPKFFSPDSDSYRGSYFQ